MEYNGFTIPTWLMDIFLFIGVIVIIELLTIGCRYYIAWKFNASGDLKQYNFLIRIFLYLLAVPVIIFGLLPMLGISNSLFDESDILGYYGAVIGGGVTVFGVYWTLNYESKKSKEERKHEREKEEEKIKRERDLLKEEREHDFQMRLEERKENNIPVFNFTMKLYSESHDLDDYDYSIFSKNLKDEFNHIDTELKQLELSKTNLEDEEYTKINDLDDLKISDSDDSMGEERVELQEELNKIQKEITKVNQKFNRTLSKKNISKLSLSFSLNINNIGLQSAILYSIIYVPKGPMSSLEECCIEQDLCYLSVPKGEVTRINIFLENYLQKKDDFITEFKEAGSFLLIYTDLYRNKYYYNVPIKIKKVEDEIPSIIPTDKYKIEIDKVNLPILPEVITK